MKAKARKYSLVVILLTFLTVGIIFDLQVDPEEMKVYESSDVKQGTLGSSSDTMTKAYKIIGADDLKNMEQKVPRYTTQFPEETSMVHKFNKQHEILGQTLLEDKKKQRK